MRQAGSFAAVVVAVTLAIATRAGAGGYPVFDASNVAQAIKQVQNGLQQIEQLRTQIQNQEKMLQGWQFTRIDGTLRRFDAVRGELDRTGSIYRQLDPRRALDQSYPTTFDAQLFSTGSTDPIRDQWVARERSTLEENRRVQNAVYADLAPTRQRVGEYVDRSNAAPGMTAAVQANNELTATLIQQVQALQTLEITRARAEVESEARRQSEEEYARQHRAWLNREGTARGPAQGQGSFVVEPVPETPILGGGR
jgi:P-type conjugative transfer protein TrbJ